MRVGNPIKYYVHRRSLIVSALALLCTGCGTFPLASAVYPLTVKSQQQQQLDNLACKDQAKLEANTAERQAGAFALGFTIVGLPLAYELERSKQREVYKSCMEARGYRVVPPNDGPTTTATSTNAPTPPARPAAPLAPAPSPVATPSPQAPSPSASRDEVTQLQKLKELRDRGLITDEEYEKKRKDILDRL